MKRNKEQWRDVSPNALLKEWIIEHYCGFHYTVVIGTGLTAAKITPIASAITGLSGKDIAAVINKAYRKGGPADVNGKRMISKHATNKHTTYLRFRTEAEAIEFVNNLDITDTQRGYISVEEL